MTNSQLVFHPSSFRDPAAVVFFRDGELYRGINKEGIDDFNYLMESGLYTELVELGMLVHHQEIQEQNSQFEKTIKPFEIPFISYPSEWSFSAIKAAALLTL